MCVSFMKLYAVSYLNHLARVSATSEMSSPEGYFSLLKFHRDIARRTDIGTIESIVLNEN